VRVPPARIPGAVLSFPNVLPRGTERSEDARHVVSLARAPGIDPRAPRHKKVIVMADPENHRPQELLRNGLDKHHAKRDSRSSFGPILELEVLVCD
jgi:hypothetical protein